MGLHLGHELMFLVFYVEVKETCYKLRPFENELISKLLALMFFSD